MTRKRTAMLAVLAGAAVALALGGCATDDGARVASASGSTTSESAGDPTGDQPVLDEDDRRRQFTQCMRDHGIDMPDPEPGAKVGVEGGRDGIDKDKMRAALEACREFMPNGGERPQLSPEDLEKMREFARCMREHGVDMPDPDPNNGGVVISREGADGRPDVDEQKLEQAFEACRHLGPKIGTDGPQIGTNK